MYDGSAMRICYVADGASIHTVRWVNYFAAKGHEVHLISSRFGHGPMGYDDQIKMHPLIRLFPHIWKVSGYFSGLFWLMQIRNLVRRIRPDVLDAHFITITGYLGTVSGFHPLILTAWGSDVLVTPRRSLFHRFLTKAALRRADIVVCDSETVKRGLLDLGTEGAKIRKIYNGVDTHQFNPQARDEALRARLGVAGSPTVICIRNLNPIYNVEMFIRAMPRILRRVPEAKFIICGDGMQRDHLRSLGESLGVAGSVNFAGWVPHNELPKFLASSDIYVSTSLSDSTSLSLQEAMACGLAPVVTDLLANREWVVDGENGYTVSPNDISALADKVVHLIRSRDLRNSFGETGRKIIQERAEYEREMGRMEKVYEEASRKV